MLGDVLLERLDLSKKNYKHLVDACNLFITDVTRPNLDISQFQYYSLISLLQIEVQLLFKPFVEAV